MDQKAAQIEQEDDDLLGFGDLSDERSIYKQVKDYIIDNLPGMKGNPENIIKQAQNFYYGLFDDLYPEGSKERQQNIPLLNSAKNAISKYVKSKGTALKPRRQTCSNGCFKFRRPRRGNNKKCLA